jgi:hypothetical protein
MGAEVLYSDGRTEIHDESNNRFSEFYELA